MPRRNYNFISCLFYNEKLIGKNDWKNIDTNRRVIYSCIMCATCETCCYGKYIFIQIYFYKYILYKVSNDG